MERHGGKINHETIAEMEYLEAVIMENLRVHTPVLAHIRVCREDCEVWRDNTSTLYTVAIPLLHPGWVGFDFGSSPGCLAAVVVTYCPSRMVEYPKSWVTAGAELPRCSYLKASHPDQ